MLYYIPIKYRYTEHRKLHSNNMNKTYTHTHIIAKKFASTIQIIVQAIRYIYTHIENCVTNDELTSSTLIS